MSRSDAFGRLSALTRLVEDFESLIATGGRLVGSLSESAARDWLQSRLQTFPDCRLAEHRFHYSSWASLSASLQLTGSAQLLACHPLYWSPSTPASGLEARIIDVGRGTEADFQIMADAIRGRIVVVRHEYPFSQQTIHRRLKYDRSLQCGAAGFVLVNANPGDELVTGACSQDSQKNIPAVGVSFNTGTTLTARKSTGARMRIATVRTAATGVNLIAEISSQTPEWVVLCAHYDGHDLAQSALDNATGVVASIAIFESFAPFVGQLRRGLRLILFTAEETGLMGSRSYLQSLAPSGHRKIALTINLDSICGSPRLTCLTSGFDELLAFVATTAKEAGLDGLPCHGPLMRNSDHFNFAQCGIPAIRLVAGFDEPEAGARLVLTEADTPERVSVEELRRATMTAGALVWSALDWPGPIAEHKAPPPA
jgi:Iap family predicted aminopeptidase